MSSDELVVQGWKDQITVNEMANILHKNNFTVSKLAIIQTWVQLDEDSREKG